MHISGLFRVSVRRSFQLDEAFTQLDQYLPDELVPNRIQETHASGLARYIVKLARLGGYLARTHDPPPGNTVAWRGLTRLSVVDNAPIRRLRTVLATCTLEAESWRVFSFGSLELRLIAMNHPVRAAIRLPEAGHETDSG